MRPAAAPLLPLALSLAFAAGCASAPQAPKGPRVMIISIDGLRPEFYSEPGWDAPNLHRLAAAGASAESAESIYPSVTYPNHTSIVTGVRSARHGVYSNTVFDWKEGTTNLWYWEASYLKAPTIWQRAHAAGKTTAIMTWPVSVGSDVDWLVPELFPPTPKSKESTWDLTRRTMKPELLKELSAINEEVLDGFDQRDRWVTKASAYLERKYRPGLTLIHLINLDHAEHDRGRDSPEMRSALKVIDEQLGRIVDAVDLSSSTVIVVGDHGFFDYDRTVNPNVLFARAGWIRLDGAKQVIDWKVWAHPSGGQAAVYSKDHKLDRKVLALLRKHAAGSYRVLDRAELDRLEALPGALCALEPLPGLSLDKSVDGEFVRKLPSTRGQHGTLPGTPGMQTGFVAIGRDVTPGKKLGRVSLLDVAPTAALLLGIEMPGVEGQALNLR